MLHFGSLQTNILRKLLVKMEASLIRHSWAVLEIIIIWDIDFGFSTFFPFLFNHWEREREQSVCYNKAIRQEKRRNNGK